MRPESEDGTTADEKVKKNSSGAKPSEAMGKQDPSVCRSVGPSVHPSVCLFIHLFVCSAVCSSVHPSVRLFVPILLSEDIPCARPRTEHRRWHRGSGLRINWRKPASRSRAKGGGGSRVGVSVIWLSVCLSV
jgi:hypothetical protein